MPSPTYHVSPYCVFTPEPDGQRVLVAQGLRGASLRISTALMQILGEFWPGASMASVLARHRDLASELRPALRQLIDCEVLVTRATWQRQAGDRSGRDRLTPVELAVHRQVDTGGYDPRQIALDRVPPARKDVRAEARIPLRPRPRRPGSMSLLTCLQERQSVRRYASRPLPRWKLEAFLQHTARATSMIALPGLGTVSRRNHPSGGARHPLELYPCLYRVTGMTPGIHHYDPFGHALGRISRDPGHLDRLRAACKATLELTPDAGEPAVLFVITAVFARTCWKYRGIPYQLIQQEVGALYQTMYLVATELGLAPCAMGTFPGRAMAEMLGIDGVEEAPVGFFALGMRGKPEPAPIVTACRLLAPAPWATASADTASRNARPARTAPEAAPEATPEAAPEAAIELTYAHGVREIVARAALRVTMRRGKLRIAALGGRRWAHLAPDLHARLAASLGRRRGRPVLRLEGALIPLEQPDALPDQRPARQR